MRRGEVLGLNSGPYICVLSRGVYAYLVFDGGGYSSRVGPGGYVKNRGCADFVLK